jgi:hypothetical protein
MAKMLYEFFHLPREREIIGRLLIAYGEIEFAVMCCLSAALQSDHNHSCRVLFRVKGEGARIEVADALIRPAYSKIGLGPKWGNAYGAIRVCKNIRNQYAHCHWQVFMGALSFMNLDQMAADSTEGPVILDLVRLDLNLLERQSTYFQYALDWLFYLEAEYQTRALKSPNHDLVEPKSIPAPPLYIRPG